MTTNKIRYVLASEGVPVKTILKPVGDGFYSPQVSTVSVNESCTVAGRVVDPTKTVLIQYTDGTTESILFDSNDEFAGFIERNHSA